MYFDDFGIKKDAWESFKGWSDDITQVKVSETLCLVKNYAQTYKNEQQMLEQEYLKLKRKKIDEHNSRIISLNDNHDTSLRSIENEKTAVFDAVDKETKKLTEVISRIRTLEYNNEAAASISDYQDFKARLTSQLNEFASLQEERKRLANVICQEKKTLENERYNNQYSEYIRQHEADMKDFESQYSQAVEKFADGYRNFFKNELMPKDALDSFRDKINEYNYSLNDYVCRRTTPEYMYMGILSLSISAEYKTSLMSELISELFGLQNSEPDAPYVIELPYCHKIKDGVGLIIKDTSDGGLSVALRQENSSMTFEDELEMLLLRNFMSFPAGTVEAFTIDTGRMGAVFHDVYVLGSRSSRIIGTASSQTQDIEKTLSTLRSKIDSIANNYGDNFEARMKREPYYALAISNFPEGFSTKALSDLSKIVKNASACGVAVYILANETRLNNMSGDAAITVGEIIKTLQYVEGAGGVLKCADSYIEKENISLKLDGTYDYDRSLISSTINTLLDGIDRYRIIPVSFEDIYPNIGDMNTWMSKDTMGGINIPVGIKGASDVVNVSIGVPGANSEHHVLIEGSTGAGKSTFLHTLITSTLLSYSPNEVEIFLVDFKAGVEFKRYADFYIPSLKIVSIESEREFGHQVFMALATELERRSEEFKSNDATSTENYRAITQKPMPKILLIMDEYQELFSIPDEITKDCENILRTLVLQGRAYGIHIILATQNVNQACLDADIYQQMVVRIALKGSTNVLASNNDGSQMLINSSDGTTIYNTNRGESSANKTFKTAFLGSGDFAYDLLSKISMLQQSMSSEYGGGSDIPSKVLYTNIEDNRRHRFNTFINDNAEPQPAFAENESVYGLFIGEAYDITENLSLGIINQKSSNLLVSVGHNKLPKLMTNCVISLLYADIACKKSTINNRLVHFANLVGDDVGKEIKKLEQLFPESVKYAAPTSSDNDWSINTSGYESVNEMIENTYNELCKRLNNSDYNPDDRIIFCLAGMDKADAIVRLSAYEKNAADEFAIGDSMKAPGKNAVEMLQELIKFGPEKGINVIMTTNDLDTVCTIFGERFYDDFGLRIGQNLTDNYMKELLRENSASKLNDNALVFYRKMNASNKKFRVYDIPGDEWLESFAKRYREYCGGDR